MIKSPGSGPKASALAILKKKHAERKAAIDAKDGQMSGLHDAFVESMGAGLAKLGAIADLRGDGWRSTKVEVVAGMIHVDVAVPKTPMVELDGLEFFDRLFKSAEDVAPYVFKHVPGDAIGSWLAAENVFVSDDCTLPVAVVSAVMRKIMKAQGWKYIAKQDCWRSPVWLFPEIKIPEAAILAHAQESVSLKMALPETKAAPDDFDIVIAESGQ